MLFVRFENNVSKCYIIIFKYWFFTVNKAINRLIDNYFQSQASKSATLLRTSREFSSSSKPMKTSAWRGVAIYKYNY